jgi:hypothetical protein
MEKNLFAQQPALYDEALVPQFTLPELLVTFDGERVADTKTWKEKRRPEILKLFRDHVYGNNKIGRPERMRWEITTTDEHALNNTASGKTVVIHFTGKNEGPRMKLNILLPRADKPVPVFLMPGQMRDPERLIDRGYGIVTFNPRDIEIDKKDSAWQSSIRKYFSDPGQTEPGAEEWGALAAWAWAMSRAMDYLVTDKDIDQKKISVLGFSRWGKVAMWAGAQDERFAIVFSAESGCGGAVIVRRGFGETVRSINGYAPHWFNGKFKTYNERVGDLPVDWHMLVALMAPRPVYVATAEEDRWGDPKGSFLSAKFAEPVYTLFGKKGLGVSEMPPVETPVGDWIGYHNRKGGHGVTDYDWEQWLNFADRHFAVARH